jgi:hypothetical protein
MSVLCKTCGEELIGVVNRCWKCGTNIPISKHLTKPPIRRQPVELEDSQARRSTKTSSETIQPQTPPWYHRERFLTIFAHAALWVGGVGCLIGLRSVWCFVPAVIGIPLGVLGMKATRRDLAATGLVLSVLALFLVFVQLGLDQYAKYQSQQLLESYEATDF